LAAFTWESFRRLAFVGETPPWRPLLASEDRLAQRRPIRTFRPGRASGRLLGGNLAVLSALVGTPYMPDFTGAILFLEETGEAEYRIDRMLTQLALAGVLGKLAGVVFGQCTRCSGQEPNYSGFTVSEIFEQHFAPLGVPAFQGAPFGHVANQVSLPVGVRAEIDAEAGTIRMLEPVVA
jgi:muramoyltetrapeptide carboxypeptidase